MSLLPTSTYAGPSQAEALWAVAGSVGPGGGVTQLVAGSGITLAPTTGEGVVTITATGGGGGVSSVTASGAGITATPTTGAVVVANTGVTSLVAGTGISLSGATGAVTVTNSYATGLPTLSYQTIIPAVSLTQEIVTSNVIKLTLPFNAFTGSGFLANIWNASWSASDVFTVSMIDPTFTGSQTSLTGVLACKYTPGGPSTPNRLFVSFDTPVFGDGSALTPPIVWVIRYAGVALP